MKRFYKSFVIILMMVGILASTATKSLGCDRSSLTLDSITPGPGGTYYIYMRLCVGAGVLGLLRGADGNTGRFLFSFSSSAPGFSVLDFPPVINSDFTGTPYVGANVGPQSAFNATQAIFYNNNSAWFACIISTVQCGTVNTECDQLRFQVTDIPDSIRIYGIEGGDNLFGGCYPNVSMLIDFTGLPVEWQDIHCRQSGAGITVDWATRNEYNNNFFEVTRSSDGNQYDAIGKVAPAVEGVGKIGTYNFFDPNPHPGMNYYRIRQVDNDGASSESETVSVFYSPESGLGWVSVSPIPAKDYLDLEFRSEAAGEVQLTLSDLQGRVMSTQRFSGQIGQNSMRLNLGQLSAGMYYLRLSHNLGILERKIVLQ